ncbi:ArsR/SmtB family transcription factor [Stakelama saccharophila]|uniref:Metalloregulator ArsR/SmtB family transcription factor n=1 Tax=Stakelama saccharophila TaxID=3075605 RepID=A0ABZ0BAM6_9SPHN|nr:metalloregulator ArsR/SmtB family transcription factor [Stakelama sp. W311]WNO54318.1 metalloregulator ArsR/SmtB family transcription factor [Stakelama sp. W311]
MSRADIAIPRAAELFSALGDRTRLAMLEQLGGGVARPIAALSAGRDLTRQAVTKHLCVLERAGLVRSQRSGREKLFSAAPEAVAEAQTYLMRVAAEWEDALDRLKIFVEE